MKEEKSLLVEFVSQVLLTFAAAMIAISIVGWFVGDVEKGSVGLYSLGADGLSYKAMLQIFIVSLTTGGLRILLLSDLFLKKMMLLWKLVLMFVMSFLAATVCAVIFQWFPTENWQAWISYIISITVCIVLGVLAMVIKIKLEDRKYDKLLSAYKEKQKNKKGD